MAIDTSKIQRIVEQKARRALGQALANGVTDLQRRLDSGTSIDGRRYKYAESTAKQKGKSAPVDWTDTGTLRRSIGFDILEKENLTGIIGIKNLGRGRTSNLEILRSLIKRFPKMWGLSTKEKQNLIKSFFKAYR